MTDIEQVFREGLAQVVHDQPPLPPIDLSEVIARAHTEDASAGSRHTATRWLAVAAAIVVVAGIGLGLWSGGVLGHGPHVIDAQPASPSAPLIGTKWQVTEIKQAKAVSDPGRVPYLIFRDRKTVVGSDGCNSLSGSYRLNGHRLTVTDMMTTLIACTQSEVMAKQQADYFVAVGGVARLAIDGSMLTLYDASGAPTLVFKATSEPSVAPAPTSTPATSVQIRLRNDSTTPMKGVSVTFGGGKKVDYGTIAPGQETSYRQAGQAYPYAYIRAIVGGKTQVLQPRDYVGVTPLSAGRYTYVLTFTDGSLDLAAKADQ